MISVLTLYEITGNPDDILVESSGPDANGKFCGFITRGPGHNYKVLISSSSSFDSADAAEVAMTKIIVFAREWVAEDRQRKDGLIALLESNPHEARVIKDIVRRAKG